MNTVFKNYHDKAVEFGILKPFSTLANNFFVIVSKLQASVSRTKLGRRSTGDAVFSEDSSSLIWPWLLFRDRELQVSWNGAQALDTSSAALSPGLTDWVSICKVVNLSLSLSFFFFANNQSYLFKTPLREKLGDQNKTKTKPRKWSIALGFGFLIYKVLIITSTWQDYCEYERRQSLLHGGRSALAALGM